MKQKKRDNGRESNGGKNYENIIVHCNALKKHVIAIIIIKTACKKIKSCLQEFITMLY